jgi:hypothetical protein
MDIPSQSVTAFLESLQDEMQQLPSTGYSSACVFSHMSDLMSIQRIASASV